MIARIAIDITIPNTCPGRYAFKITEIPTIPDDNNTQYVGTPVLPISLKELWSISLL